MDNNQGMPLTSNHWGSYRADVENGRLKRLLPFENDRDPSKIADGVISAQDDHLRIESPMVRESWLSMGPSAKTNLRGSERFVAISWDEAEKLVAGELKRVIEKYGNSAIFAGSYGWASAGRFHHAQSHLHRFLNCLGGYTKSKFTYSFAAAEAIIPHILGSFREYLNSCTSWESIIKNTDLMICFGGVPLKNGQICQGGTGHHYQRENLIAAAKARISFVNISPIKTDILDNVGATWLAPRPNTDTALLLAIAHSLYVNDLVNFSFLDTYTEGFEVFRDYFLGKLDGVEKTAAWAAQICDLMEEEIISLSKQMAANRTMISVSWSLTRQDHGEQPFWAAIAVAAMLGQIGLPGGGFGFGYSAVNHIGGKFTSPPAVALPQGKNSVDDFIPVARISDLLLKPGQEFDFNGKRYTYPITKLVYWAGGNPFHHHQDLSRLVQAWKTPETIIAHDWCWNALAKRSDIVLPCTIPIERQDIALTPRDPYIISMSKLVEPFKLSRDDFEIFSGIARVLGFESRFTENRTASKWIEWIYKETRANAKSLEINMPEYRTFLDHGWFELDAPQEPSIMLEQFRKDPQKNRLKTPSGKIEIFSKTIADFNYPDCPGYPFWAEPIEWLGGDMIPGSLHLISNQPADKLHSQLDHGVISRETKINGRQPVHIHPEDAKARNISQGDLVKVFNKRGACIGSAKFDYNIREGVIQISTGAWFDPTDNDETFLVCKNGNPNVLTPDKGTSSLGQGPVAHSCLVEVELVTGEVDPVTAYDPPQIIYNAKK